MEDPNVYNAMIRGSVRCSSSLEALRLYLEMSRSPVSPTSFTFSTLVKACIRVPVVEFCEAIHSQVWKAGFESQMFVQTSLIDFYSNCRKIAESRRMFEEMLERDIVSWTTLISAICPRGASWNTMIAGYASLGDFESAALLFGQMPCKDLVLWTTMISCYSQNKQFREVVLVFKAMRAAGLVLMK
ncbi:hypothetical protein ACLOJK_024600 [Asimina triloba]